MPGRAEAVDTQRTLAQELADEINTNTAEDVDVLIVLDSLAMAGLKLVKDEDGIASSAYLRTGQDPDAE